MPKTKQTPPIVFRLLSNDQERFDELCRTKGKNRSQLAREAVVWYLENQSKEIPPVVESLLEKRIRKMEERMAALQARTAIDIGIVFHLIFRNMDKEKRGDQVAWAYGKSIERLKRKLSGPAGEIKEMMQQ
jgi:hypothetical protein